MADRFQGFRSPHYTQVPDDLFDELLADLSGAELKVLLYVMRRTFGFKKGSDRISKSQLETGITRTNGEVLDRGTGLSRRAVRLAVASLVEKNILLKRPHSSARKGHEATEYALNVISQNSEIQSTPRTAGGGVLRTPGRPLSALATRSDPRSTQGMGMKVPTQETVRQESNVNVPPEPHHENDKAEQLLSEMLDVLGDRKSTGFYRKVARTLPDQTVFALLSETKHEFRMGRIRKTRGAHFTDAVKRLAREKGYDLGLNV